MPEVESGSRDRPATVRVTVADLKRELEAALRERLATGGPLVRRMYFDTAWALDADEP